MILEKTRSLFDLEPGAGTQRPIALLGIAVSSGNRGVQALGASLITLLQAVAPGASVLVLANHDRAESVLFPSSQDPVSVLPARLSPRARWRDHLGAIVLASLGYRYIPLAVVRRRLQRAVPWIKALARAGLVGDIRGGDSFSDLYGMGRFLTGFLSAWAAILVRGDLVQLPQTYGPYRRRLARCLACYLLRHSSLILARDAKSQATARALTEGKRPVRLCPDVAFALPAREPRAVELEGEHVPWGQLVQELREGGGRLPPIGLNVNGLMYNGGYSRKNMFRLRFGYAQFVPRLVERLLEFYPGEIWLVPHTYGPPESVESDPEACRRVQEALPSSVRSRVRRVTGAYDCCRLKAIIGLCDFFVGSRMHSCIAALSQGVPCAGIAYSSKFQGVFETVGVADWVVDGRTASEQSAIDHVLRLCQRRSEIRPLLAERAARARQEVIEVFKRLVAVRSP